MAYSFEDGDSGIAFFKDGKQHWCLSRKVEMCTSPEYSLISDDGCRIAFCGWWVVNVEYNPLLTDEDEATSPITVVLDMENRKYLWVYEGHVQPLVWNGPQDDIDVPADCAAFRRIEGRKWNLLYALTPDDPEYRPIQSSYEEVEMEQVRKRLVLWEELAPGFDTALLEEELENVRHLYPWAERSLDPVVCRSVVECLVHGKSYEQQHEETLQATAKTAPQPKKTPAPQPSSNTPLDELASRWPDGSYRRRMPRSKRKGEGFSLSNNALVLLSVAAISVLWIWGSIALYQHGYKDAAGVSGTGGLGVIIAIISRIVANYELRFGRGFLLWRLLFVCAACFSTLTYRIAEGIHWLLSGMPVGWMFLCESAVLAAIVVICRVKSGRSDSVSSAKRWAWVEAAAVALFIGAFVYYVNNN